MIKHYKTTRSLLLLSAAFLMLFAASCKKDKKTNPTPVTATPKKVGLYELQLDSTTDTYRLLLIPVSKIGTTQLSNEVLVFDTGSGGMVIDAQGVIPASMITDNGFNFTGDSTVVDGITITNQTDLIQYGDDANVDNVYGNLAYADVTVGDGDGKIAVKRMPFFLYYKATDKNGNKYDPHNFDVMGVSTEYDITFNKSGVSVQSPFSYYDPGNGLTKGFKMSALGTSNFTYEGKYVSDAISVGLTANDISSSGPFNITPLRFYAGEGYLPFITSSFTYNSTKVSTAYLLFDTGTEPYNYLEDPNGSNNIQFLAEGSNVSFTTNSNFKYSYTVRADHYQTYVENPNTSGDQISVLSLEFFFNNSYMTDYTNHTIGLKNGSL